MDHLGINVDQFLWVPSIGKINPRYFFEEQLTLPYLRYYFDRFTIYFDLHFGGPRYAISESICIIDVDVNHYKIILYYLLWVLSIAQINSTEVSSYLLIFILFQILYVIT